MDEQIVAVKGLLSAAEEQQTKDKHNFSDAGRLNCDIVDRGCRNFLVSHKCFCLCWKVRSYVHRCFDCTKSPASEQK